MPVSDIQEVISLIEGGRAGEVVPTLEYLAELFPTSATAHILLARAFEAERDYEQALAAWRWAATLVPNSPSVRAGMERAIYGVAVGPAQIPEAEPFPPELVPPETDDFVDLTGQPDGTPHFYKGPSEEATGAPSWEEEPVQPEPSASSGAGRRAPSRDVAIDDLDRLISELESARITPDPDFSTPLAPEAEEEVDDMVSETLARIYAAQRQYGEAARVYEKLAEQHPDRATEFSGKAEEMHARAESA